MAPAHLTLRWVCPCLGVMLGTSIMTVMLTWTAPPNETKIDLSEAEDSLALAIPLIAVAKPRLAVHVLPKSLMESKL
ncbi:hypothetical protein Ddye_019777 [Dipteronia dyeriana]|uniref:Uncharacterized protein n=1 Tax=Dipteronia dyeriana TaxID=168575 RepID=A0AAD9WW18_9ROSI|nr:hypothetical protein Ddye_019777 [Dipteronia dyeriana]